MDAPFCRTVRHIDELLLMIFLKLDDRSLARAACVCKHWAEIALDQLWREVSDVRRILNILAPLSSKPSRPRSPFVTKCYSYTFRRPPDHADWRRFDRYSRRIRTLRYDPRRTLEKSVERQVDASVFEQLAQTCPHANILPNLHTLTWYPGARDVQPSAMVFMHGGIKELKLELGRMSTPLGLETYLTQAGARCAGVTRLDLRIEEPVSSMEAALIALLKGLTALEHLTVPMYGLTTAMAELLSTVRTLRSIEVGDPPHVDPGSRADVHSFVPVIERRTAFPALRDLSFSTQLPHAAHFIRGTAFLSRLSRLRVNVISVPTATALEAFFQTIRDGITTLSELAVDYIIAPDAPLAVPPPPLAERPTLATFRPLFPCTRLRVFELRWDYALALGDADMDAVAAGWPALETLLLHYQPAPEAHGPRVTLRALVPFARHCPRLRTLGLRTDAREVPDLPEDLPPFRALATLAVGLPPIADPERVALFLGRLCPLGCALAPGIRWPDAFDIALQNARIPDAVRMEMSTSWVRWSEVVRLLPIATRARLEERARMGALEAGVRTMRVG